MMQQHPTPRFVSCCCRCYCWIILLASCVGAEYLNQAQREWMFSIPGGGSIAGVGFRKGNAIVVSKNGKSLYATSDDGNLHIINLAADPPTIITFEPDVVAGTTIDGRLGVTLHEEEEGDTYAIYAILDVPNTSTDGGGGDAILGSRVIAVNSDASLRWERSLSGYITGNLVINNSGKFVYLAHNVINEEYDETDAASSPYRGKVKVLLENNDRTITVTASLSDTTRRAPLGPVSMRSMLVNGAMRDVVFVGESWSERDGRVYALLPSQQYDALGGQSNQAFEFKPFSDWPWPTVIRPTISLDGTKLFMGGMESLVAGWIPRNGETSVTDLIAGEPAWELALQKSDMNPFKPISNPMSISSDGRRLYAVGGGVQIMCIDTESGTSLWSEDDEFTSFVAPPLLAEREGATSVIYSAEYTSGNIRQNDATSGARLWTYNCGANSCPSIEADFSVSGSGNFLYYGDIFGNIVSLRVGTFVTPAPSVSPTLVPTGKPTLVPTQSPVAADVPTTARPTDVDTPMPTIATSPGSSSPIPTTTTTTTKDTNAPSVLFEPTLAPVETATPFPTSQETTTTPAPQDLTGSTSSAERDTMSDSPIVLVASVAAAGLFVVLICLVIMRRRRYRRAYDDEWKANAEGEIRTPPASPGELTQAEQRREQQLQQKQSGAAAIATAAGEEDFDDEEWESMVDVDDMRVEDEYSLASGPSLMDSQNL